MIRERFPAFSSPAKSGPVVYRSGVAIFPRDGEQAGVYAHFNSPRRFARALFARARARALAVSLCAGGSLGEVFAGPHQLCAGGSRQVPRGLRRTHSHRLRAPGGGGGAGGWGWEGEGISDFRAPPVASSFEISGGIALLLNLSVQSRASRAVHIAPGLLKLATCDMRHAT